ncbi:MAG: MBL fold metallo-hydrolase [Pyrinomonadaceae bacterium]
MKTELEKLKTYAAFAHRFGGKFLNERLVETQTKIAPALHQPRPAKVWDDEKLTVAWLGHATVLINFYGTWLLTDPALRSRVGISVGGLLTMGPRRLVEPALAIHQLPKLDGVLLSHAHMDHTDRGTLRRLPRNSRVVVQHGNRDLVKRFRQTDELGWGDSTMIDGVRVESIEVNHWGRAR